MERRSDLARGVLAVRLQTETLPNGVSPLKNLAACLYAVAARILVEFVIYLAVREVSDFPQCGELVGQPSCRVWAASLLEDVGNETMGLGRRQIGVGVDRSRERPAPVVGGVAGATGGVAPIHFGPALAHRRGGFQNRLRRHRHLVAHSDEKRNEQETGILHEIVVRDDLVGER